MRAVTPAGVFEGGANVVAESAARLSVTTRRRHGGTRRGPVGAAPHLRGSRSRLFGIMSEFGVLETGHIRLGSPQISYKAWESLREPVEEALRGSIVPLSEPERAELVVRNVDLSGSVLFDLVLREIPMTTIRCGVGWTASGAESIVREITQQDRSGRRALPYLFLRGDLVAFALHESDALIELVGNVAKAILLDIRKKHTDAGEEPPIGTECSIRK